MTDYERGVEQASAVYKEVIREYVAENTKLREESERIIIKLNAEHIARQNVESENAKLREVLESVLKCAGEIKRDSGCDTCPMYRSDGSFADGSWCRLRPELRSLGFEEM